MSQNNPSTIYAGLDVAKASLALDFQGRAYALANDAKGHARLLVILGRAQNVHVVLEATGGYEPKALSLPKGSQPCARCTPPASP